jgi:hypothetical protein
MHFQATGRKINVSHRQERPLQMGDVDKIRMLFSGRFAALPSLFIEQIPSILAGDKKLRRR